MTIGVFNNICYDALIMLLQLGTLSSVIYYPHWTQAVENAVDSF